VPTKAELAERIKMAALRKEAKRRGIKTGGRKKVDVAKALPKTVLEKLAKRKR